MAIKWQEKPDYWLGATKAPYPRFEAWQSNDAVDNGWCLNIIRGADLEPVEIREIQNSRALAAFAEGFLEEWNNSNVYSVEFRPSIHLAHAKIPSFNT
jgi:hypothetical protein